MNREQIIEAMARGMYGKGWDGPRDKQPGDKMKEVWREYCRPALTALETAIPGLADVISGKAVVVPVEPTEVMIEAAQEMAISGKEWCFEDAFRAMIEARPK